MTKPGWGILGTGWVARMLVADLLANGFRVTAVGSRQLQSAQSFADEFGITTAHGSYEQLVEDPHVDIVYVATPNPFHVEHASLALNAGKHVLLEKPFTLNASEARSLFSLARQKNLVLLEAMWTRFLPHMVRVRAIIASGALGEIRTLIADHSQKLPSDLGHRVNSLELGGGALLDLGVYPVSFAQDLLGSPSNVYVKASLLTTGVDRQFAAVFDYAEGQQAVLQSALDTPGPNTAVILGTEGWISIDPVWHDAAHFTVFDDDEHVIERFETPVNGRGMHFQAMEIERLIEEDKLAGTIMPPQDTIAVLETMDEMRRQIGLVYPQED